MIVTLVIAGEGGTHLKALDLWLCCTCHSIRHVDWNILHDSYVAKWLRVNFFVLICCFSVILCCFLCASDLGSCWSWWQRISWQAGWYFINKHSIAMGHSTIRNMQRRPFNPFKRWTGLDTVLWFVPMESKATSDFKELFEVILLILLL